MLLTELTKAVQEDAPRVPVAFSVRIDSDGCPQTFTATSSLGPLAPAPPLFLAYSCTKTFIAALLLGICHKERLSLETPVRRWFPALPLSSRMTLRHLLNHTSGLPDYGGLTEYHQAVRVSPSQPWSREEFLERTLARGVLFEPGGGWSYSNIGYLLLKGIVEMEGNDTLRELVAARITRPLALQRTFVPETVADLQVLHPAASRLVGDTDAVDVRAVYHPGWVSHGVVASTSEELAEFYHRLLGGDLLPAALRQEMATLTPVPCAPPQYVSACYGLGLMADAASPFGILLGHNGGGPGYQASVFHAADVAGKGVTAGALCACEDEGLAERVVMRALGLATNAGALSK